MPKIELFKLFWLCWVYTFNLETPAVHSNLYGWDVGWVCLRGDAIGEIPSFSKTELKYAVLTCELVFIPVRLLSKMNTIFFWFLELILSQHREGKSAVLMSSLEPEAFSVLYSVYMWSNYVILKILDF